MEFKVPFQYKYGYIRDEQPAGSASVDAELVFDTADEQLRMLWLIMSKAAEMSRLTTIVAFLLSMFTTCSSAVYRASATVRRLIDVNSTLVFAHASNVWVKSQWVHPNRALDTGVIGEICAFRSLQITMAETPRRENLCRSAF